MKLRAFMVGAVLTTALVGLRFAMLAGTGRDYILPAYVLFPMVAIAGGFVGILFVLSKNWRRARGAKGVLAYWLMGSALFAPIALVAAPYDEIMAQPQSPSVLELAGLMLLSIIFFGGLVGIGIRLQLGDYSDE